MVFSEIYIIFFFQENAFENVVCHIEAILFYSNPVH